MNSRAKKVVLFSKSGYAEKHDALLHRLIERKVLLFCTVGKDGELWHDIMDELVVIDGLSVPDHKERDFFMMTTWHEDETLNEVIEFAKSFEIEGIDNKKIEIIEI